MELACHGFNIARAGMIDFRTGQEQGRFQSEVVPNHIKMQNDMAAFGQSVLDDSLLWWEEGRGLSDLDGQDLIDNWYGMHSRYDVLERTV